MARNAFGERKFESAAAIGEIGIFGARFEALKDADAGIGDHEFEAILVSGIGDISTDDRLAMLDDICVELNHCSHELRSFAFLKADKLCCPARSYEEFCFNSFIFDEVTNTNKSKMQRAFLISATAICLRIQNLMVAAVLQPAPGAVFDWHNMGEFEESAERPGFRGRKIREGNIPAKNGQANVINKIEGERFDESPHAASERSSLSL